MKPHQDDPLRLDVADFAAAGRALAGRWAGVDLPRLAASQALPHDSTAAEVCWTVRGERRPQAGGEPEVWLELSARTLVWLTCQRCLQPLEQPLAVQTRLRFVRGQAQAEALDAEVEEDVLALTRSLDLRELVEDELLLALPLVPRHGVCPQPLPMSAVDANFDAALPDHANPFAALRALQDGKPRKPG